MTMLSDIMDSNILSRLLLRPNSSASTAAFARRVVAILKTFVENNSLPWNKNARVKLFPGSRRAFALHNGPQHT